MYREFWDLKASGRIGEITALTGLISKIQNEVLRHLLCIRMYSPFSDNELFPHLSRILSFFLLIAFLFEANSCLLGSFPVEFFLFQGRAQFA